MRNILEKWTQVLCPPGNGVFTIHTAQEKKESLHLKLFGKKSPDEVRDSWTRSLGLIPPNSVCLLGICSDAGGGIQRGANWGPLFIREKLIESGAYPRDLGDVRVIPHFHHDKYLNKKTLEDCREALYGKRQSPYPVSALSIAEEVAIDFYQHFTQHCLLGLGGDHSVAYPLLKAYLESKNKKNINVGLLHFDAHTDLLHSRLGVDLCFGSWLPPLIPLFKDPKNIAQIGLRSSGSDRSHWEKSFGLKQYWADEIKKNGADSVAKKIVEQFKSLGVEEIYVSFDIDALDLSYAGATGTPEPGGLTPFEAISIMQAIEEEIPFTGADLCEVAPFINPAVTTWPEPETTLLSSLAISNYLLEALHRGLALGHR